LHSVAQRRAEAVDRRQLDIESRLERTARGVALPGRETVICLQRVDGEVVGHHDAVEAEIVPQEIAEERARASTRHAVELVIRVQDRGEPREPDRRLEREDIDVAQLARTEMRRRPVLTALRCPVPDEVLAGAATPVARRSLWIPRT